MERNDFYRQWPWSLAIGASVLMSRPFREAHPDINQAKPAAGSTHFLWNKVFLGPTVGCEEEAPESELHMVIGPEPGGTPCPGRTPLPSEGGVEWLSDTVVVARAALRFTIRLHPELHGYVNSSVAPHFFIWGKVWSDFELSIANVTQPSPDEDPNLLEGRYVCRFPPQCRVQVFAISAVGQRQATIGSTRHTVIGSERSRNWTVHSSAGLGTRARLDVVQPSRKLNTTPLWERRICSSIDLAYPEGQWLSEAAAGLLTPDRRRAQAQLFSGWTFDVANCRIPRVDIAASTTWILVLGTSTDRGVFQSLVDMLLPAGHKINFMTSEINKCWGYYDVTAAGVRLTYQDMRIPHHGPRKRNGLPWQQGHHG